VGKLINIYRVLDRADYRKSMVKALDDISDLPISAQVAGYASNRVFPTWTAIMQTAGAAGVPAYTATSMLAQPLLGLGFVGLLPLASPRAMSRLMIMMSGTERGGAKVVAGELYEFITEMGKVAKAKGFNTEGLSVAMVAQRILNSQTQEEEKEEEEDLLGTLGSIPAPSTLTVP